jgi:hypothetical protein
MLTYVKVVLLAKNELSLSGLKDSARYSVCLLY